MAGLCEGGNEPSGSLKAIFLRYGVVGARISLGEHRHRRSSSRSSSTGNKEKCLSQLVQLPRFLHESLSSVRPVYVIDVYKLTPSNGPKERCRRARDLTVASDNLSAIEFRPGSKYGLYFPASCECFDCEPITDYRRYSRNSPVSILLHGVKFGDLGKYGESIFYLVFLQNLTISRLRDFGLDTEVQLQYRIAMYYKIHFQCLERKSFSAICQSLYCGKLRSTPHDVIGAKRKKPNIIAVSKRQSFNLG
ncbi:hypothetical protein ANN_25404 [Periplaneta americana]|uniref:Uncharacterized protein n=1 Tax=Periplaneta americana TaxID=6978 RepID=A0ABQ8S179_PERAM|nr:hypothetical protein ANN_25404 [Periplaneta americana]